MRTDNSQVSDTKRPSFVLNGTVVWFDDGKGYGFIRRDDGGRDVYVHYSDIVHWDRLDNDDRRRRLVKNQRVEFEIVHGDRGRPAGKNVKVVSE